VIRVLSAALGASLAVAAFTALARAVADEETTLLGRSILPADA
jgi:hypothetical protein